MRKHHRYAWGAIPMRSALPLGSDARYCPGTMRRHPVFPKVSQCTTFHAPRSASNSTIEIFPESDPITR
jgi:hypothetical protein